MPLKFTLDELIDKLHYRLKENLPGAQAHDVMRAVPIGSIKPVFEHKMPPKLGSVLILLYPHDGEVFFPLTERPQYVGAHSGQISLPGGKAEIGEDAIATALREGQEEIGIDPSQVQVIGRLSEFFVIPSNFLVTPIVGYVKSVPSFVADPVEVEKIILGNISELLDDQAIRTKEIVAAGRFHLEAPHFEMEGKLVWGATAMMLNELREILRK